MVGAVGDALVPPSAARTEAGMVVPKAEVTGTFSASRQVCEVVRQFTAPEVSVSQLPALAWKLVAQGRGHHAKQFVDPEAAAPLLAPDPAVPFEQALEHLSERIWRLHGQGARYGLALGGELIPAGAGTGQRDRCLAALATCR